MEDEVPPPPKFKVILQVHTVSREEFKLTLGDLTRDEITSVNNTVQNGLLAMQPSKDFTIVDDKGVAYHFNCDHIVCVEVHVQ